MTLAFGKERSFVGSGVTAERNLFHLDFFGCHYYNHTPDSTRCAFGLQLSEATKFVMGYMGPSETMRMWNLLASTWQQFNCTTLGSLTSPRGKKAQSLDLFPIQETISV